MRATSLASSHLLLWRAAEYYGLDPESLFREAGLEPERIKDTNARYSESASTRLLSSIIERSPADSEVHQAAVAMLSD